ncbi:enamine deaminase RidA (YjgF/YER057c/UK114 family) [Streptomyces zagrosensis]|uniref:Enamine deaminase RidA (YjgF/YER057c/UK114 family) n=1 Tax=Streptomyces zagrosensis TaxID=1042984 RepID=A0A7W9Q693_9ACTN|nr:enamine deaminase RidA (YjgF/YER057c/UK114 family) [Streptomyces zagrosensis]
MTTPEPVRHEHTIERHQSESPWEETIGSARAVAAGDLVFVAGTMPLVDGVLQGEGDPYEQTLAALRHALAALGGFGLGADAVLRTRVYFTHARDVDAVSRAHREIFAAVRPATTLVVVSGFVDSRVLVEVELEAFRPGRAAAPAAEEASGTARTSGDSTSRATDDGAARTTEGRMP